MVTNSGRVKRQGYDIPPEPVSSGYEAPKAPSSGYEAPANNNGYESPTAKGPVPAGQRQGAFQPAAHPPATLYCQCEAINCPPGPPGVSF